MVFGVPSRICLRGVCHISHIETETQNSPPQSAPFVPLVYLLEYQPSSYRAYQRSKHKYPLLSSKMRDLIFSEFCSFILLHII